MREEKSTGGSQGKNFFFVGGGFRKIIHMKKHKEKSSDQLRPQSQLGPQGARAVSGRLVDI